MSNRISQTIIIIMMHDIYALFSIYLRIQVIICLNCWLFITLSEQSSFWPHPTLFLL